MRSVKQGLLATAAAVALTIGISGAANAAFLTIANPGTPILTPASNDVIPTGTPMFNNAGNAVLQTTAANVVLEFLFWGSESGFNNKLTTAFGNYTEVDNAPPPPPFPASLVNMNIGGVQAAAGTVAMSFSAPQYSPAIGNGAPTATGSVVFNYITDLTTFAISATPTDYVLFALDDGGAGPDDNHDDFVGVVVAKGVVPIPAALPLMLSALGGLGLIARRRKSEAA